MITNGYTTLENVKAQKRISVIDVTDDAVIERLVEAASRYIDGATGRRFYTTVLDETRTFQAANGERCYIDDLNAITSLKTDEDGDRTYEITWAATDYDLLPDNASLDGAPYTYLQVSPLGRYSFPAQRKGVQIVGKFGYAAAPDDIESACEMIVVSLYQNRFGNNSEGAATITGAGVVITPKDIPAGALEIIKKYKRFS